MSHPSIFTVWESWKFSNCIFVIPKAFWLFLWQWEKSKMYSVIAADYFSEKNGEYFYGVIDQLDVSSEMSDDVMPAWQRQAVCKSQGYFFPPHRTCKAIWIIFYGLQQWGSDFCAKWDRVLNYLEQMERTLDCWDKNGRFLCRWIRPL